MSDNAWLTVLAIVIVLLVGLPISTRYLRRAVRMEVGPMKVHIAEINRAVNHRDEGSPTVSVQVDTIERKLDGVADRVVAVDRKLDHHLAHHQIQREQGDRP